MKSLVLFTLSAIASASALAVTPIEIFGTLEQTTTVGSQTQVNNTAHPNSTAIQNVSSNKGYVTTLQSSVLKQTSTLGADSSQVRVENEAKRAGDIAVQNVSSNYGTKTAAILIERGTTKQETNMSHGATLRNKAEGGGSNANQHCTGNDCKNGAEAAQNVSSNAMDVTVKADLTQQTSLKGGSVSNQALGKDAFAQQNLASNAGKVTVGYGGLSQTVHLEYTNVSNTANSEAKAVQSLASNANDVSTGGAKVEQTVSMGSANISNSASSKDAAAVQNLASNYDGVRISASLKQTVDGSNGYISNTANGSNAQAFQNLASNLGKVTIAGTTTQIAHVYGSVTNYAGTNAVAMQNMSSNDACEPPKLSNGPSCPTGGCGWTVAGGSGGGWGSH